MYFLKELVKGRSFSHLKNLTFSSTLIYILSPNSYHFWNRDASDNRWCLASIIVLLLSFPFLPFLSLLTFSSRESASFNEQHFTWMKYSIFKICYSTLNGSNLWWHRRGWDLVAIMLFPKLLYVAKIWTWKIDVFSILRKTRIKASSFLCLFNKNSD